MIRLRTGDRAILVGALAIGLYEKFVADGDELLAAVDEYAEMEGTTRAGALRVLVHGGLSNQLAHIREFCNTVPERGSKWDAYELACEIRDFIDGDTDRLPL